MPLGHGQGASLLYLLPPNHGVWSVKRPLQTSFSHWWAISHEEKQQVVSDYFNQTLKYTGQRHLDFNWDENNLQRLMLQGLEARIIEEEVLLAILLLLGDKAPGSDDFTGCFYKTC